MLVNTLLRQVIKSECMIYTFIVLAGSTILRYITSGWYISALCEYIYSEIISSFKSNFGPVFLEMKIFILSFVN